VQSFDDQEDGKNFSDRASRDSQKSPELGSRIATVPLGNVGGDRDGSAAKLTSQCEPFFGRQPFCQSMDFHHEVQRALPHVEIPEVPDLAHAVRRSKVNA
jgi:hypothetical protein